MRRAPSIRDIERMINAVDTGTDLGYRDRTIFELLFSTGSRRNELLGLELPDLLMDDRLIYVRKGKGDKERVVPMGRVAAHYLETYIHGVRNRLAREETNGLFLNIRGKPNTHGLLNRIFKRYSQEAGLEQRITPHLLRHACATEMLRGGANIRHVQELPSAI